MRFEMILLALLALVAVVIGGPVSSSQIPIVIVHNLTSNPQLTGANVEGAKCVIGMYLSHNFGMSSHG